MEKRGFMLDLIRELGKIGQWSKFTYKDRKIKDKKLLIGWENRKWPISKRYLY